MKVFEMYLINISCFSRCLCGAWQELSKALFGSISSVLVATIVRSDLSAHGKVIRNSCPVPETVFISVMELFALRNLLTWAANWASLGLPVLMCTVNTPSRGHGSLNALLKQRSGRAGVWWCFHVVASQSWFSMNLVYKLKSFSNL